MKSSLGSSVLIVWRSQLYTCDASICLYDKRDSGGDSGGDDDDNDDKNEDHYDE